MKSFMLRTFVAQDVNQVIELLQEVSVFRPDPLEVPTLASHFESQENSYACVALHGLQIVGFGSIFVLNRVRGGCSAIIEDMVVAASTRRQGVGRLVLEDLLTQARVRGCFKVGLEASELGRGFYHAMGFKESGLLMKYSF